MHRETILRYLCHAARAAAVVAVVAASAAAQGAPTGAPVSTQAPATSAPPRTLPPWLEFHGEQRTRFESIGRRYRTSEVGSDDVMGFRTRLQARITTSHVIAIAELQDARMALTDSASTITNRMTSNLKFAQLSAGVRWRNLGAGKLTVQVEAGRFSRQYGNGRVIARPPYGNVSNSQDGAVVGVSGRSWSVQTLAGRPAIYAYPSLRFDDRFRRALFGGVYATSTRVRQANVDAYYLRLDDGGDFPAPSRRKLHTTGARFFGTLGAGKRIDYESESVAQWGLVGRLSHRAFLEHAQVGYAWPKAPWAPHLIGLYDHATGDADPTDARSGAFDTLFGRSRFELGPTGIFGLVARSNLRSPGVWLITTPVKPVELAVQHRWAWLAQARDRWRPIGLVDPTGRSGTALGSQTDFRLRYRWRRHLEVDGAAVYFHDGAFVRARRPNLTGRPVFFVLSTEWSF